MLAISSETCTRDASVVINRKDPLVATWNEELSLYEFLDCEQDTITAFQPDDCPCILSSLLCIFNLLREVQSAVSVSQGRRAESNEEAYLKDAAIG